MEVWTVLFHHQDVEPLFEFHSGFRPLPILMLAVGMSLFITFIHLRLKLRRGAYLVLLCIPFSILLITVASMTYGLSLTIEKDRLTGRMPFHRFDIAAVDVASISETRGQKGGVDMIVSLKSSGDRVRIPGIFGEERNAYAKAMQSFCRDHGISLKWLKEP